MTIDPTALQQARLHIGHIRICWPLLDDARTTRITRPTVALSGRAAQARDADLQAERADRQATIAYRALGASPAPLALNVIDAEVETLATVGALIWAVRSDLREWSRAIPIVPAAVQGKLSWLTTMLDRTSPDIVDQAAADLTRTARQLAAAVQHRLDDDWHPTGRRCPCCSQRALQRWTASTNHHEHTIECTGQTDDGQPCRCTGNTCPCQRPGARAGSRHLWPAHTT